MANFTGQLRSNEIFGALFNMIISQTVFADNLEGLDTSFVSKFRVDGSQYGDTKLFISCDVLGSKPWTQDSKKAVNVLELHRPENPETQAIYMDVFRQLSLTTDEYMSKRAWSDENSFGNFMSVMTGMIRETKNIYDYTTIATFIGTTETETGKQLQEVVLSDITATGEEANRLRAQKIAQKLADLFVDIKRPNRSYNDYGNMRSFSENQLRVIWNSKYVNEITKLDLPTIFHKDGLMNKFDEEVLPPEYFGVPTETEIARANNDGTYRSLYEAYYTTATCVERESSSDTRIPMTAENTTHVFAGDIIPAGTVEYDYESDTLNSGIDAGRAYVQKDDIICKIIGTKSVPFMSAFEVATSFFNGRNLSTNSYLTWGHNTLDYLNNYPFITLYED